MILKNEHEDKDNDNILIVVLLCLRASWCLLVLARALRRHPYLCLAPIASTGRQESIIRKKGNGVCAIEPIWLLYLGAQCLHVRWEGVLAPSVGARTRPILLIFIRQRVHTQEQQKRGRGGNQLTSIFSFREHAMSEFWPGALWPKSAVQMGAPALSYLYSLDKRACAWRS